MSSSSGEEEGDEHNLVNLAQIRVARVDDQRELQHHLGDKLLQRLLNADPSIRRLNLSCQLNINTDALRQIAEALTANRHVTEINLSSCKLGDAHCKAIATLTHCARKLRRVRLSGNSGFTAVGLSSLLSGMRPHVKSVSLSDTQLSDQALTVLADFLKSPACVLRCLDLAHNSIYDTRIRVLTDALYKNESLEQLSLDGNPIGDVGAELLANALRTSFSLKVLCLKRTDIGDAGAKALASCLVESNRTLESLDLKACSKISVKGASELKASLERNDVVTVKVSVKEPKLSFDHLF